MGLHEVKMTPEEEDAYIASRITDLADSIINIKKYVEMLENKPMVRKDWERCDNTIDHFRDAIMLECHFLSKVLGETISRHIPLFCFWATHKRPQSAELMRARRHQRGMWKYARLFLRCLADGAPRRNTKAGCGERPSSTVLVEALPSVW